MEIKRFWINYQGPRIGHVVLADYGDNVKPRTMHRSNSLLAAEAELLGLAREKGLKVVERTISRVKFLTATR